jgi:hypothetical protein
MNLIRFSLLLSLSLPFHVVQAQQGSNAQTSTAASVEELIAPSVEVNGTKDPDWKRYRAMIKGVDAFEKHHTLAPGAEQKFILRPRRAGVSLEGISLRLAGSESSLAVPLFPDGSFVLPRNTQALEEDAELLINRKRNMFRWWPHIRSAQLGPDQRRLGDLRLECEMFWAINYDDAPFILRNLVRALGGPCTTKKVSINFPADYEGLKTATLVLGDQRIALQIDKKSSSFLPPLFDQKISNDAIIFFEYEETTEPARRLNYSGLNVAAGF